jgi:hypothetical protein
MKTALCAAAIGVAMLTGYGLSAQPAQAGYVVDLTQQGANVVETGNGSLDLTALTFLTTNSPPAGGEQARINASFGLVVLGPTSPTSINVYKGLTGPSSFGSGSSFENANSGLGGSPVGVAGSLIAGTPILGVPVGYVSGASLGTSTNTWDDATFASLGVTRGTYTWTWGSGKDADSFRLIVVPEPATWAMLLIGFGLLGLVGYRKTRLSPVNGFLPLRHAAAVPPAVALGRTKRTLANDLSREIVAAVAPASEKQIHEQFLFEQRKSCYNNRVAGSRRGARGAARARKTEGRKILFESRVTH